MGTFSFSSICLQKNTQQRKECISWDPLKWIMDRFSATFLCMWPWVYRKRHKRDTLWKQKNFAAPSALGCDCWQLLPAQGSPGCPCTNEVSAGWLHEFDCSSGGGRVKNTFLIKDIEVRVPQPLFPVCCPHTSVFAFLNLFIFMLVSIYNQANKTKLTLLWKFEHQHSEAEGYTKLLMKNRNLWQNWEYTSACRVLPWRFWLVW